MLPRRRSLRRPGRRCRRSARTDRRSAGTRGRRAAAWPGARCRSSRRPAASGGRAPRSGPDTPHHGGRSTRPGRTKRCRGDGGGADLAGPDQPKPHPEHYRCRGHQHVDAAQQPPVSDAHLAAPGREPQKCQPTDRPLQQHRGGIEADHAGQANDPARTTTSPPTCLGANRAGGGVFPRPCTGSVPNGGARQKMLTIAKPFGHRGVSRLYS